MNKFIKILWPIQREELKKFLPMAFIMFCILFNYQTLRNVKDALIISSVGAEALSFLKLYIVIPFALFFTIGYMKLLNVMSEQKAYYTVSMVFILFLFAFAFFFYPYGDFIHPHAESINSLVDDYPRFKWFILLAGKWTYALMYVFAELWGSIMLSLLFWQFANKICTTAEAKRFYSTFGLIGNFGLILSGTITRTLSYSSPEMTIQATLSMVIIFCIIAMALYRFVNVSVLRDPAHFPSTAKSQSKSKLSFSESVKVILHSKYLGFILLLVICYGITINVIEGPWKAKVRELYPTQNEYMYFMGMYSQIMGIGAIAFFFVGSNILRLFKWRTAALITPLTIVITGLGFFILCLFQDQLSTETLIGYSPIALAVFLGIAQNVLSKATKYSLFDSTKEMAYIPLNNELKTKGKAAVDVIGGRFGKAGGALLQSSIFLLFPSYGYGENMIVFYLMSIFVIGGLLWFFAVNGLNRQYIKFSKEA